VKDAVDESDLRHYLDLDQMKKGNQMEWTIRNTSTKSGVGVEAVMSVFEEHIKQI
jgi:ribosomal protein L19